jgi:hypothetical protein
VRVPQQAVADGVGQRRVGEAIKPLGKRDLAGDDGGAVTVGVLQDLGRVAPLLVRDGREASVAQEGLWLGEAVNPVNLRARHEATSRLGT